MTSPSAVGSLSALGQAQSSNDPAGIAEQVVTALLGSKRIRVGPLPGTERRRHLVAIVGVYVAHGAPVQLVTPWGALKGYGLHIDRLRADCLDVAALRRYAHLDHDVRRVYAPGLHCTILREDLTEVLLTTDHDGGLQRRMNLYGDSLSDLVTGYGLNALVSVIAESTAVRATAVEPAAYLEQARGHAVVLADYWRALRARAYRAGTCPEEYARLQARGWVGDLPEVLWRHYLARAQTERPHDSEEQRAWAICLYFGNALARRQSGVLRGPVLADQPAPVIKASFAPYPKGVPEALHLGRIEYKVRDSRTSHTTTPPWAGYGDASGERVRCVPVRRRAELT